jgi:hypothetical protein
VTTSPSTSIIEGFKFVVLADKIPTDQMSRNEKRPTEVDLFSLSSGGRTRTYDLWVMSPTSYQLLHPAEWAANIY